VKLDSRPLIVYLLELFLKARRAMMRVEPGTTSCAPPGYSFAQVSNQSQVMRISNGYIPSQSPPGSEPQLHKIASPCGSLSYESMQISFPASSYLL